MQENLFKINIINYWRNIDKKIFFCFIILFFFLGLFFSLSSTSFLAGERLNKDNYFFFSKHLIFSLLALVIMVLISAIKTSLLKKIVIPIFLISLFFLALVPIIGVKLKVQRDGWIFIYLGYSQLKFLNHFSF